jgi:serine/threonine protein kinase
VAEDSEVVRLASKRVGTVLRGKYRIDSVLGVGGMAVVYAATHRNAKRFAVKMLHPELSIREDIRTRFLREGYVANSVQHPGAVAVLDDDLAEDGAAPEMETAAKARYENRVCPARGLCFTYAHGCYVRSAPATSALYLSSVTQGEGRGAGSGHVC